MTKARVQPFCRAKNNNLRFYGGERVFRSSGTERNITLFLYNILFFSIWKPEGVSFNRASQELKNLN